MTAINTPNPIRSTTNNRARDLLSFYELTEEQRAEFDYLDDEEEHYSLRFFMFRGMVWDAHEFERSDMTSYDGVQGQSYFDAVAIRYVEDQQRVVVSHLTW
jgi:hypothetical protein